MAFRCLFHVHSGHSFDSILSPRTIVAQARQLRVDALIVTDHNTIQGSLDARTCAGGNPRVVVTAAEYQSEKGDIMGLFLKEEIRSRLSADIVREIHLQEGLVVLPHPYKAHLLDDELLAEVDLIEVYNGRCTASENARAEQLARQLNRPFLAGPDAHTSLEVGAALNEFMDEAPRNERQFREQLLYSARRAVTRPASRICRPYSQMIKAIKTRNPRLFLYQAKRMIFVLAGSERN